MRGPFGRSPPLRVHVCGLYYNIFDSGATQTSFLPQTEVKARASILATTSRTVLTQTFVNPFTTRGIRQVRYIFPLYDGVSVVGFSCHVGDRLIVGEVKEKERAKEVYNDAVARGESAGLLEQLSEASDVFTTTIGNIPPGARVIINITYLGELKHDMEVDGIRYTIPTSICPRYGSVGGLHFNSPQQINGTISITVDAEMAQGSYIQKIQSPTHPIAMSMGTTSVDADAAPSMIKASATLSLGVAHLETDFVLQIIAKDTGTPKAILETHPTIPDHRALMATLIPKFALPPEKPEIVLICDQSGSMAGRRMELAIEALQVFLKSLPVGVKFNICSFGNHHSFMVPRSAPYNQENLNFAVNHAANLQANYGGTNMLGPLRGTIENRYRDMPLDIILLTDGEIWNQQHVFDYLNEQIQEKKAPIRVFTLGIGSGVSHSLIEGIAKAGNGFSQSVQEGEKMSSKVVRMLKGALSPHITDYTLEVKYAAAEEEDDDFEMVEKVVDSLRVKLDLTDTNDTAHKEPKMPISLFDTSADPDQVGSTTEQSTGEERYAHLPSISSPKILQAPQSIPPLFAFNRTTVYLLFSPDTARATPTSVILRGTSTHGPLELEIPIQVLGAPGDTIHQLAAKKAVSELEQGRGWLASAVDSDGQLLKTRFDGRFSDMVEREAVRLGVQFQVGGKWCSFVATEKTPAKDSDSDLMEEDWEYLEVERPAASEVGMKTGHARNPQVSLMAQPRTNQTTTPPRKRKGVARTQTPLQPQQQLFQGSQPPQSTASSLFTLNAHSAQISEPHRKPAFAQGFGNSGIAFGNAYTLPPGNISEQRFETSSGRAGSVFGASPAVRGPAMGSARSGGLFGANPPQGRAPSGPATSGGLFGASFPQSGVPTGSANSASLFGRAPSGPATSGGLFGASSSHSDQLVGSTSSASLFGGQPSGPATSEGLFGAPPAPNAQQDDHQHPVLPQQQNYPTLLLAEDRGSRKVEDTHESETTPQTILNRLLTHQSFSGCFSANPSVLSLLHISAEAFARGLEDIGVTEEEGAADVLTTALVVVYMERKLVELKGEWELVVEKARGWVDGVCGGRTGGVEGIFRTAARLVNGGIS